MKTATVILVKIINMANFPTVAYYLTFLLIYAKNSNNIIARNIDIFFLKFDIFFLKYFI